MAISNSLQAAKYCLVSINELAAYVVADTSCLFHSKQFKYSTPTRHHRAMRDLT
jgi:hypothetical protein